MSNETIALDLDAIQARADAATRGPWKVKPWRPSGVGRPVRMIHTRLGCLWNDWDGLNDEADGEFIVHARDDVPALVAEVHRLRAALGERSGGLA